MNKVLNYGKNLIESTNLKDERRYGIINIDYESFKLEDINSIIDCTNYNIFYEKENGVGFYMNWHIDDAQIIKENGLVVK